MKRNRSYIFFFIDVACIVLFGVGLILFSQIGKPYKRGFFCNDESIQKPYKDSTVPTATAAAVGFALSFVVIVITELYVKHQNNLNRISSSPVSSSFGCFSAKIPEVIKTILWVICADLFGAALNQFVTDVGKYSLGRLRPHFLDVCKPNWSKFNCTDSRGNYIFIVDDVCTVAEGTRKAKESRLSFPSGHSSFSAYLMVFLALYIEAKLHLPKESKFLKPLIQAVVIMMALYTGFSRVSDYKHHWSDVLAGFSLGTTIAFITVFRILRPRFGKVHQEVENEQINVSEIQNVMSENQKYTEELP